MGPPTLDDDDDAVERTAIVTFRETSSSSRAKKAATVARKGTGSQRKRLVCDARYFINCPESNGVDAGGAKVCGLHWEPD